MKRISLLGSGGLFFVVSCLIYFLPTHAKEQSVQSSSTLRLREEKIKQIIESPIFDEFDGWISGYLDGDLGSAPEDLQQGETLAAARRELFKQLIEVAPREANQLAISDETYRQLPTALKPYLERRFSANGDLLVRVLDQIDPSSGKLTSSRLEREIVIGQSTYAAYVYGRRSAMTSKLDIPLRGIILDGIAVIDESPVRKIETSEFVSRNIEINKLGEAEVVAEVGGELLYFSDQQKLDEYVSGLIDWEAKIGPVRPDEIQRPGKTASSWTVGPKSVLLMRVDFSDKSGEPIDYNGQVLTQSRAQNLFVGQINPFYVANSYNKTSLQVTVTPVIRLPQPVSFYVLNEANVRMLLPDARIAARAIGFETNNFDLDIVAMGRTESPNVINFNAFASGIGIKGVTLNGQFDPWVIGHELGHNFGLSHANVWRTDDGTVIGPGAVLQYSDYYNLMGACGLYEKCHFSAIYKHRLDWLTDANIQPVTTDGVYRVFAHDSASATGTLSLVIRKDALKNYRVEFRQLLTTFPNAMNGAFLHWDYPNGGEPGNIRGSLLLDNTPSTISEADQPILVGQHFIDSEDQIRISVLGKGGTNPESLDVRVNFNFVCTFNLSQFSQSFSSIGGEGSIPVTTQDGCRPAATSNETWITFVEGNGSNIDFEVSANSGSQPRIGIITVAGQIFTVQQSAATSNCVPSPSGLVAWWRGEGNGMDQTGVNNGTLLNNMSFGGGKIGQGFSGTYTGSIGGVEVPDTPSLALNNSITIEGWLKLNGVGGRVIQRRQTGFPFYGSYHVAVFGDGSLHLALYDVSTAFDVVSSDSLPMGQFVHFATTFNDSTGTAKMYVNGSLVRQSTTSLRPNMISGAKTLVGDINGITDELSVYGRALSRFEIEAIYNAGISVTGATGKCLSTNLRVPSDFDGDGKSDVAVWRETDGVWYMMKSSNNTFSAVQFGMTADKIVPGDYDGDGKTDVAVYRPSTGTWYVLPSTGGFTGTQFGLSTDLPAQGDFDGDGKTDIAVFRPSTGTWYQLRSTAGFAATQFGANGDKPVVGDYDGDGKSDIAVFRPSDGVWYQLRSSLGFTGVQFGIAADKVVPADYDGDGKADLAVYRDGVPGIWYLLESTGGFVPAAFGTTNDIPTPGDFDGDGKTDVSVYRPSIGTWYLLRSTSGFAAQQFGSNGDKPVEASYVPTQ